MTMENKKLGLKIMYVIICVLQDWIVMDVLASM